MFWKWYWHKENLFSDDMWIVHWLGLWFHRKWWRCTYADRFYSFNWLSFKSGSWNKHDDYDTCCSCRCSLAYFYGANVETIPLFVVVLTCLIGALSASKFANKCDIKKLNKVIGFVLVILGIITILIK